MTDPNGHDPGEAPGELPADLDPAAAGSEPLGPAGGEAGEGNGGAESLDAVPDALDPPDWPKGSAVAAGPDEALFTDPGLWGGEAVVRETEYGPPIPSHFPDPHTVTGEVRELERRWRARLTPAFPLEARRLPPLRSIWRRYRRFAMRDKSAVVDEMGRDPIYASRYQPLLDFLYRRYFRTEVEGIEHVPDTGRAILVANHSGALPYDAIMLMRAVEREHPERRLVRPLLEDDVFHFPYLGRFLNRLGGVRACPENAERLLADGQLVAVFPEGVQGIGKLYRDRYQLQRFGRGGFVKLALRTRSPIVPVAVVGAEEATPMVARVTWLARAVGLPHVPITPTFPLLGPAGLLPLPSKWKLRFGAPLDLAAEHGADAAGDRLLVARLAERVRGDIQEMINDLLASRQSIARG